MATRPGGEMASRVLDFIWIADCSGSMEGEKIQTLNYAIRQAIPEMQKGADDNPNASVMVRAVKFSSGAQWHIAAAVPVDQFSWVDLVAGGVTDMGRALEMVATELRGFPTDTKRLPPVLVLLTDGQPTDDFKKGLEDLMATPWGKKAVRIAIAIGQDTDLAVLEQFTANKELVLEAKNSQQLVLFIKWASTVIKTVSSPRASDGDDAPTSVDTNTIPQISNDDDDEIW